MPHHNRSVIFQMHVENMGDSALNLTRVRFLAEPVWDVQSCNEIVEDEELGVFARRMMEPKEVYQCLYVLAPKQGVEGEMPFTLGRVEIGWLGSLGERGTLVSGVMKRRPA